MCSVRIRQSSPARGPSVPRGDDDRGGDARAELDALRPASDSSGAEAAARAAATAACYAVALIHATAVLYHGPAAFNVPVTPTRPTARFDVAIAALVVGPGRLAGYLQQQPYGLLMPQSHIAHLCAHTRTSPRSTPIGNEHAP